MALLIYSLWTQNGNVYTKGLRYRSYCGHKTEMCTQNYRWLYNCGHKKNIIYSVDTKHINVYTKRKCGHKNNAFQKLCGHKKER